MCWQTWASNSGPNGPHGTMCGQGFREADLTLAMTIRRTNLHKRRSLQQEWPAHVVTGWRVDSTAYGVFLNVKLQLWRHCELGPPCPFMKYPRARVA
eukprot:15471740-Alexandrium_andersonii.AAC.1